MTGDDPIRPPETTVDSRAFRDDSRAFKDGKYRVKELGSLRELVAAPTGRVWDSAERLCHR